MSVMATSEGMSAGAVVALLAAGTGVFAALVVGGQVVQGPLTEAPAGAVLVMATAFALAGAAATATLLPTGSGFEWRADGIVCAGLLVALAGAIAAGWEHGADQLRSAGSVVAPMTVPLLAALAERRARGTPRWSVAAAVVVAALSVTRYAVRDPFRDPGCWSDCSLRGVAPLASSGATALVEIGLALATLGTAALSVAWTIRLVVGSRARSSTERRLALVGAAGASTAAALWAVASVLPDRVVAARLVAAALVMQCLTALLVSVPPLLAVRRRRELRSLAAALGDQPPLGTLEATLSRMLGDRDLRVAYWLPQSGRYVDAAGESLHDAEARPSITLQREGQPLARIHVDRVNRELEGLVGSAAALAIDSERLQAEVRAQLSDLLAARLRIVAAADDARRGVERSIHDEVQSELIGALLELAQIRSRAVTVGAEDTMAEADTMTGEIRVIVDRLREFSRGVYPAVLDAAGLPAALEALADEAPVAVRIDCRRDGSASVEAQRAAYLIVHDAVARATRPLDVSIDVTDRRVALTIVGHPGAVPVEVRDRVGALGGTTTSDRASLRAVLPCG